MLLVGHRGDDDVTAQARAQRLRGKPAGTPRAPPSCRRRRARRAGRRRRAVRTDRVIPSTPTVSRCPHSSSVRPPPRLCARMSTLGRPGALEAPPPPAPRPRPRGHERGDLGLAGPTLHQRRVDGVDGDQPESSSTESIVRAHAGMMQRHERRARRREHSGRPASTSPSTSRTATRPCCAVSGELDLVTEPSSTSRARRRPPAHRSGSTCPSWPSWTRPACARCSSAAREFPDLSSTARCSRPSSACSS